eukprot:6090896-Prymnesium_polylepis.1
MVRQSGCWDGLSEILHSLERADVAPNKSLGNSIGSRIIQLIFLEAVQTERATSMGVSSS